MKARVPAVEVVEVFGHPAYALTNLRASQRTGPSCFNGLVNFELYRVTVEKVQEDPEVLFARLVDLWETSDNMHHMGPLKRAAAKLGREFSTQWGSRRTR